MVFNGMLLGSTFWRVKCFPRRQINGTCSIHLMRSRLIVQLDVQTVSFNEITECAHAVRETDK